MATKRAWQRRLAGALLLLALTLLWLLLLAKPAIAEPTLGSPSSHSARQAQVTVEASPFFRDVLLR